MQTGTQPRAGALRSGAVVLAQAVLVAAIYRPTLRLAFLSDAWVYLGRLRRGVWPMLATPTGYHYQPVACAWIALVRAVFGESAVAFQAVNMGQLVLLAFLTYQLGLRLLASVYGAFLASVLVIGSAAFYEASYSPLSGNMHLLGGILYVAAVIVAHDVANGRFGPAGPWLLGSVAMAAVFSHPAMVTVIPVCAWTLLVLGEGRTPRTSQVRSFAALGLAASLFIAARVAFAAAAAGAPRPSLDPMRAYLLVARGVIAAFTLRGSEDALHALTTLGTNVPVPGRWIWAFVGGWLLAGICLMATGMSRRCPPGVRILVVYFGLHVGILAVAAPLSSRQAHVAAVPAALLTAWTLTTACERVAAKSDAAALATRLAPAAIVVVLVVAALADHHAAADVHGRAALLSRTLEDEVRAAAARAPVNVTLVNMPGHVGGRGVQAAVFENGLDDMVRITAPAVGKVDIWRLPLPGAPDDYNSLSVPSDSERLRARLLEPSSAVILYQTRSGPVVLTPAGLDDSADEDAPREQASRMRE